MNPIVKYVGVGIGGYLFGKLAEYGAREAREFAREYYAEKARIEAGISHVTRAPETAVPPSSEKPKNRRVTAKPVQAPTPEASDEQEGTATEAEPAKAEAAPTSEPELPTAARPNRAARRSLKQQLEDKINAGEIPVSPEGHA